MSFLVHIKRKKIYDYMENLVLKVGGSSLPSKTRNLTNLYFNSRYRKTLYTLEDIDQQILLGAGAGQLLREGDRGSETF